VEVVRDFAPALPPLLAQRAHISEIFINLLQNAREAMNGQGRLNVSAHYGDNYCVVVQIADNGPGIAPDYVNRIFEPYFTTKEKGTGLGLAIVRHNAELYNGSVRVESELGNGTRFTVVLPARTMMQFRK
jgi:signal transduction histidine kinase